MNGGRNQLQIYSAENTDLAAETLFQFLSSVSLFCLNLCYFFLLLLSYFRQDILIFEYLFLAIEWI